MQNLRRKSKGVRRRDLKTYLYFRHLLRSLKNCKIYHVLHWYASLAIFLKNLSSLRLIWGYLGSFQRIYRLTHLSPFRPILSSYKIILNIFWVFWVRLCSFRHILSSYRIILTIFRVFCVCLGSLMSILAYLESFRLIWVHLDSLELI